MKVFLAGAAGVIGRRLVPLLRAAGHDVVGTTRSPAKADAVRQLGAEPVVVDVFDAPALDRAVANAAPDAVIHQLTDLPAAPGTAGYELSLEGNARLRIDGTANLVAAARAAGVRRMVSQSIAFVYAPGEGVRVETDPLDRATGARGRTVEGVAALERATLSMPEGIVLRYGFLFGAGTWFGDDRRGAPAVHVDAAAQAAVLALGHGRPGIYNIAEDAPAGTPGAASSDKAKRDFGFDAAFRLS
jgi:nucleoside-diphosphate-sugar epimerase